MILWYKKKREKKRGFRFIVRVETGNSVDLGSMTPSESSSHTAEVSGSDSELERSIIDNLLPAGWEKHEGKLM